MSFASGVRAALAEIWRSPVLSITLLVALVMIMISLLLQIPQFILRLIPPFVVYNAHAVNPRVAEGGELLVSYHMARKRLCRMDIDRFFWNELTNQLIWRQRVPGGATGVGETKAFIVSIALPPEAVPSKYVLRSTITSECAEGIHVQTVPDVRFEIIPRDVSIRLPKDIIPGDYVLHQTVTWIIEQ